MNENSNVEEVMGGNASFSIVDKLDKLRNELSSSNILSKKIGRGQLLNLVDEILDALPAELRTARWIVREQQSFLSKAKEDAEEIIDKARTESENLISDSYVIKEAVVEANALIKTAEIEIMSDRARVEDEIDGVLKTLEETLQDLLNVVDIQKKKLRTPRVINTPDED